MHCLGRFQTGLLFAELRVDEIGELLHGGCLVLPLGNDGELRALDEAHAHQHEDALGVNLLALRRDLDLGLELRCRLNEYRCGTRMNARLVLDHNCFLRHVNISHPLVSLSVFPCTRPLHTVDTLVMHE